MTNTRQPGYYRVKYNGKWTIGKWIPEDGFDHWAIPETEYYYSDKELDEIDPTPVNPEPQPDIPAHVLSEFMPAIRERIRQIEVEGWSMAHDDEHENEELAQAAACYAYPPRHSYPGREEEWPWDECWFKQSPNNRKRELEKAMALLAAEYGRLSRIEQCAADQEAGKV